MRQNKELECFRDSKKSEKTLSGVSRLKRPMQKGGLSAPNP
ncbi:hypothetical protein AGR7A_Cc270019 [Agrobacterium deltaense NCPPB 1641]|uniref:Uncharacterized protein n=1 Tax=Agrobacterium deltaense NCPPB 1641 TaxID=1183425 RepID=A0A1S7TNF0_9HYPH|nr:hypothetical protein AGR7A_Cc270019 [Agrobacterium deltaense NCPPB 1641]